MKRAATQTAFAYKALITFLSDGKDFYYGRKDFASVEAATAFCVTLGAHFKQEPYTLARVKALTK